MSHLALYLFGAPRIKLDGEPAAIAAQKAVALLAYLALTGVCHRRDALATLFWPDYGQTSARTYLRQALHELTKAVGHSWFQVDRESIGMAGDVDLEVDVHEFRDRVTAGDNDPEALRGAVALYTDDLLAGFTLPDCPEFDRWQQLEGESLRRTYADALQRLMHWHTARQEYPAAIELGSRWLELDGGHEAAHRALMQLYAWSGRRTAALRQYEECKRLLWEVLQTEPEPATQTLYETIRSQELPAPPAAQSIPQERIVGQPPQPPPAGQRPLAAAPRFLSEQAPAATAGPFVGRERELEALAQALAAARLGTGQVLFVIGGAGRGKTMLVQEFARRAQRDDPDLLVAGGICNAYTGTGDPYLPFREILLALTGDVETKWAGGQISTEAARRLWDAMPLTLPPLLDAAPDLIAAFAPLKALQTRAATFAAAGAEWFQRLAALTDKGQRLPIEERRLVAQFAEALKAIATQRPLLLILEDLHWVDAASNNLLFHLSRVLADSRILLAGTYRPDELAAPRDLERHPLAGIVGELKRHYGDIWLDLGRLAPEEGRAFVDAYVDTEPNRLGEEFRTDLFRHTGGHALFTAELLRHMQERGSLHRDGDGCWVMGKTVDWSALPPKMEGVIEQRIGRLDQGLQAILTAAGVEGEVFTAEVTAHVQQLPDRDVVQRLSQELDRQHRLVAADSLDRVGPQRLSRYRFRHHLFQRYLYRRLAPGERAYLHEEVGRSLEALYAGDTAPIAVQLAHHFEQAGLAEKAVAYLQQAGEQAHRLSANQEAIRHLSRALELLASLPASEARARQELSLRITLGRALVAVKGLGSSEALEVYRQAYELCREMGDSQQLFRVLHGVRRLSGESERIGAEKMLEIAETLPNPIYRVSAHHILGNELLQAGELGLARAHLEQCLALYEPRQHQEFLLLCGQDEGVAGMANLGRALWHLGYPDQALRRGREAIALAEPFAHPMSLSIAMHFTARLHLLRGDIEAAHRQIDAVLQLAEEQDFASILTYGTVYRGEALLQQGQVEAGIVHIERAIDIWRATGTEEAWRCCGMLPLADAYGRMGQVERALELLEEEQARIDAAIRRVEQAELFRLKGDLLLAQAKEATDAAAALVAEAEASFLQAVETARQQQAKSLELRAMLSLCRLWQRQGKAAEARSSLADLYSWFTEGFDTADLVAARRLLEELGVPSPSAPPPD